MSSADALFDVVTEMRKSTAELAKGRETVEKLVKAVEALREPLDQMVLSLNFQKANTIPKQQDANTGPLRPVDTTPSQTSSVTTGPWKANKYGEWIFANANEPLRDTLRASPDHTVILNGMKYKLSGSAQEPDKFINRQPVVPQK
jgi:hypothetical protein